MNYKSQRIAYHFFVAAVLLFAVQVIVGLVAALQFIWPHFFFLNFNTVRTLHINALVVWLLLGLMGSTYYIIPEESKSELWSMPLARFQFWATIVTVLLVILGYIYMGLNPQANRLVGGILLFNEGREYIEAPRWADVLLVISILLFLFNNFMTVLKTKRWTSIQGVLLGGLVGLALMYLPGMFFTPSISKDQFWWWWVVHMWVEGTWEVIAGAILCFMLTKATGAKLETLEKWMYIEVALVLFTGILGIGHHYYWIGAPSYWLAIGGVFSALEPIPLLIMVWDAFKTTRELRKDWTNKVAIYFIVGHALLNFVGAGIWGIIHTLPVINRWTHGTQITTAHGHIAFFGAYVLLILSMIYLTLPEIKAAKTFNQNRGLVAFWFMTISMIFITLTITGAGLVQVYMERLMGLPYVTVKGVYNYWFWVFRAIFGLGFIVGVGIFVRDFFLIGREKV